MRSLQGRLEQLEREVRAALLLHEHVLEVVALDFEALLVERGLERVLDVAGHAVLGTAVLDGDVGAPGLAGENVDDVAVGKDEVSRFVAACDGQ